MDIKNVTVIGSGVLGSQIAFQIAYSGFKVTVFDINDEALVKAQRSMVTLTKSYERDMEVTDLELKEALSNLIYTTNLETASKEADLIIEAIPEIKELKINLYKQLATLAPESTIFATNTSTFLPSDFAAETGRPDKFLALHFANQIWLNNTAEIMGTAETDPDVFETIVAFSKNIGMIPLPLYKEQRGYILNSLLVPLLKSAEDLLVNEVANPETIDKTWMIATKSPRGPFGILDIVGLNTAYNIALSKDTDDSKKIAHFLKENYLDKGHLGIQSGQGFYTYPNPSYLEKDFLTE
ncbi:3-hydroxyacyl-CoA dehydrogenase [Vagococcus carniphilus]|uniref:3-hydroxyacyl-CoA dehydrogenase n=1 Tax=Vagococcus carniphilus TaxID=218144 RepID=A0AAW8U335_9ENTE|nr:3-hydroxyacyl-CoA dehydrogenase [Vagococcus carniphilus]MDT2813466.1 3-hydroxyacyl-CoA dehydrogenase [Vagococcus carniphilus]MDT2830082.1 3-hydroxyacyl-CoA dehydrogenase [Vagococcus carniphilus]MDT2833966.1 3-hydroxyacyl-CoA dehydrogenase [Vagococcus carniphilus]MDT2838515.1 3-hydroxyacyl-CoA dehydrogenase [Vagococcus carniphilus]MDT2848115.1 3-hydroxyacyl-CoA dehydrogenase [Vagococcus carniphilus]